MRQSERIHKAQDFIIQELQRKGIGLMDVLSWDRVRGYVATGIYRLSVVHGEKKSVFTFMEDDLLAHFGSKEWEKNPLKRVGDILKEVEMAEKIGATLVGIGAMKTYQVVDVIHAQEEGDSRLFGEIAIDLGYINDEVLRKYVEAKAAWEQEV